MKNSNIKINQRTIRSFVRHERAFNDKQAAAYAKWWQQYGLDVATGFIATDNFLLPVKDTILEIGFGTGEALVKLAKDNPDKQFLGIEVYQSGIYKLMSLLVKERINNIRIFNEDSKIVLKQCIKDGSLSAILIFFPDPWPKRRHHKRRLMQSDFLKLILRKLKPNGFLHFVSDNEDYAKQVAMLAKKYPQLQAITSKEIAETLARPATKFAKRAAKNNQKIHDLIYKLTTKTIKI